MKENIKWIALLVAIIIFGIIVYYLNLGTIIHFDNIIYDAISKTINSGLTQFLKIVTTLGGPLGIICILILLTIFIKKKSYKKYIWLNLIIIFAINQLLKLLFYRERPNIKRLVEENGFSFPSGHSMVSTAFYGFLIYLIYKEINNKKIRNILITILVILVATIGISRIYLGVHYASDVIGGISLAVAYLIIYIKIIKQNWTK